MQRTQQQGIEKRKEDAKVHAVSSTGAQKRPSKTTYQKQKDVKRYEQTKFDTKDKLSNSPNGKCFRCGQNG